MECVRVPSKRPSVGPGFPPTPAAGAAANRPQGLPPTTDDLIRGLWGVSRAPLGQSHRDPGTYGL